MSLPIDTILCGDCLSVLKTLPDDSIHLPLQVQYHL